MAKLRNTLFSGAALAIIAVAAATPLEAVAQAASESRETSYAIAPQNLSSALRQFAEASGLQLVYDTEVAANKTSPGATGRMSSRAALAQILSGSGLTFQISGDRAVIITSPAVSGANSTAELGVRAVGVVNVEGISGPMPFGELVSPVNGVNGSRDVQATEGTGSYTTGATSIVSKVPTTLKDTPQTVSVVTSQRIADQGLVSVEDILQTMPGITTTPGGNGEEFMIYSRGFAVNTFSFDGGAPVTFDYNNRPALNMAEFDSVQLARGATGLFGGYGDPGGMVNLVRKKPLDREQFTFELDAGSYANFREVADYTGPLTADKSLRGRIVASHQSKNYYYDIAKAEKTGVYGVLEYDLTPKTLVTFGASYNRENNRANVGGLPRYSDGSPIDWPVSTCLCVPWSRDQVKRFTAFGTISYQISDNWLTKLNATYDDQRVDGVYIGASALIPPGATSAEGSLGGFGSFNPVKQIAVDYTVTGKFKLLGRQHVIIIGGNYLHVNNDGGQLVYYPTMLIPDIFAFDPSQYIDPNPTIPDYLAVRNRQENFGVFGSLTLQILKNLRASIGLRYSGTVRNSIFSYSYTPDLEFVPNLKDRSLSKPNLGVNFDVTRNLTIYGSYQSIYQPQIGARYVLDGRAPPPITGSNSEGGIKWQSPSGKLNASLAAYRIIQKGFLGTDFSAGSPVASPQLFDTTSKGIDVEVIGEILPGWQISANYTYNDNILKQSDFFSPDIRISPRISFAPRHLGKFWTTYRGTTGSRLANVILGGGLTFQSSSYQTGSVCVPDANQPTNPCPSQVQQDFTTKGYLTFALKAGYRLSDNIEMSLIVNNITDVRKYISTNQQNILSYNYYLEPRSFFVSTRFKW